MLYRVNLIKFFFPIDDNLYRIREAEALKNVWRVFLLLLLLSIAVYTWMAGLGLGSQPVSETATALGGLQYEVTKFWFVLGRMSFAVLFALLVLFIPSLIFYWLTGIPYKKLLVMQQIVLFVMLVERVLWIPLAVFWGLDWHVSPWSFGIIASYFTEKTWIIYFCGAISLFQFWIIWFQARFISFLADGSRRLIWTVVIILHILYWGLAAALAVADIYLLGGWFG
ncbi:hypothetical protein [Virgibacillus siamensis]|uniref:hypothetical protein n=1 Tax=Virgibacillus siamensis TaxID=480071 RepID=UPI000986BB4A|nr:hypothetical protein [Virgibacillus siamensis]